MRIFCLGVGICGVVAIGASGCQEKLDSTNTSSYPATRRVDSVDTINGYQIANPYSWLEDLSSAEVWTWVDDQDELARKRLEEFEASNPDLKSWLHEYGSAPSVNTPVRQGDQLFFMAENIVPGGPALFTSPHADPTEQRLLAQSDDFADVGLGPSEIVDFQVSESARLAIVVARELASDRRLGRILDIELTTYRTEVIEDPWLGRQSWNREETEIVFSGRESGRGSGVWRYSLADNKTERLPLPKIGDEEIRYEVSFSSPLEGLIVVENRVSGDTRAFYLPAISPDAATELFAQPGRFGYLGSFEETAYFYSFQTEKVLGCRKSGGGCAGSIVLDLSGSAATSVQLLGGRFVVTVSESGSLGLEIYRLDGTRLDALEPPYGLLWTNFPAGWPPIVGTASDRFAYTNSISLHQPGIYEIDLSDLRLRPWRLHQGKSPESSADIAVDVVSFESSDGEMIPMALVHKAGLEPSDGAPLLMWVYGAHGFTATPFFNAFFRTFVEVGGVLAMPQVRGGGAHGPRWYEAGSRANKRNTIADSIAALDWLRDAGIARAERTAVMGNSAGTVPAFAAAVARGDLVSALILEVPVTDLIRHARWSKGWATEFGEPTVTEELDALLEVSPYEQLDRPRELPATLILAGENDSTAPPHHAFKLAAAMQNAQTGSAPVLLYLVEGAGHQIGVDARQRLESQAHELAFLSHYLGLENGIEP